MRKYINMLLIVAIFHESKLPVDPQNISKDQKYYAKLQTTGVKFFIADNILVKEVPLQVEESVSYFSWVPDTHLALIGISSSTSRGTSVTLKPVNLDTNSRPQEPKISGLSGGSKIDAVAFSPQVNVTYILVKGKTLRTCCYMITNKMAQSMRSAITGSGR